uniref:Uncharacterized protein n=1 Tax=Arcella intermedia TaxID=1963864 RepID=A0A6B2LKB7_9EUKA
MKDVRIVVFGSGGVGKTKLCERYICQIFVEKYDPNIEESYRKVFVVDGSSYVIELLDTAGTQQFTAMRDLYIKNANGIIIVYSIISETSFTDVPDIHSTILGVRSEKGWDNPPIIIAGNKIDLADKRVISKESGEELANQLGCAFLETSAKTPTNVDELFETCGRMIIQHKYPTLPAKKKGGGCSLI